MRLQPPGPPHQPTQGLPPTQQPHLQPQQTQQQQQEQQQQQQQLPRDAGDQGGGDESVSEALSKDVFSTYVCRSLQRGVPHPGDIAEASGLRCDTALQKATGRSLTRAGH